MKLTTLLRTIRLRDFLSFGPATETFPLGNLNVIIGANGSGKSNLIEALSVIQAAPLDLPKPIREGGGVMEWLWKGPGAKGIAEIELTTEYPLGQKPLRYRLSFTQSGQRFDLNDESIEDESKLDPGQDDVNFYYRYRHGRPALNTGSRIEGATHQGNADSPGTLKKASVSSEQSILAQKKGSEIYPEITWLGEQFSAMKIYREWRFDRHTSPRKPQQVDLPEDFLLEDASNLALVLNDILHRGLRKTIIDKLNLFYEGIEDITTKVHGGTIQVYVHEKGMAQPIPATRLSDGTLRYLCLICVLCHPEPPALICIEEPELGIHTDILPKIGEMLIEASQKTQLIVTTHSDALVSSLSDIPDAIVVCEREIDGTHLSRLDPSILREWLEKYKLGDLWRMGEIGGNRW
ncbi:MAG: AAA family ATPase [Desulfatirhabdiaceae bacterium]